MTRAEILKIAKPILFNTDMVRAILDGRKTATRRVVKLPKWIVKQDDGSCTMFAEGTCYKKQCFEDIATYLNRPYRRGDILYVRETWYKDKYRYMYRANYAKDEKFYRGGVEEKVKWKPSIHMPKEAARIFLKVKDVRVERLQDITEDGALKEGIHYDDCPSGFTWKQRTSMVDCYTSAVGAFGHLWNTTIKSDDIDRYSWEINPWVWVHEFERIEPESEV